MAKLFVGNFSYEVDDEALKEFFSQVGTVVSAKVMREGPAPDARSRGFGFVEMENDEVSSKAIEELNGKVWNGRVVKVNEDRSSKGGGGSRDSRHSGSSYSGGRSGQGGERGGGHVGFFRAQPLDIGTRKRKKLDPFVEDPSLAIDYKDPKLLSRFMSERGRILPRRMTGLTTHNQRLVTRAIKRAQHLALLSYTRQ